jgi:beta-galactosidase
LTGGTIWIQYGPIRLLTQYFRPPFPVERRWRDDLARIAETGLDAIEVWATWAWIESTPGTYDFGDFDRLFDCAEQVGLDVVVTSVAELNPYWIHREVPGSHMVDHLGRRVESSSLAYTHHGICPGGCTDHPEVRARVGAFLEQLGRHFAARPNLRTWDCWNELRWAVQADGHVCFCEHSVAAYHAWLRARYGDLAGLNSAWRRRYVSWDDVLPGTQPGRSWTETVAYLQFLTWRASENVTFRADRLRAGDGTHPVIAHSVVLSSFMVAGESPWEQPLSRGNDWEVAARVDGFGASHFPGLFHGTSAEYGARLESARSAAAGKPYWVCELQGGAAANGFVSMQTVPAARQNRWIWSAYARGAEVVALWCWRDEVFGRESGGFGVIGSDGHAAARLAGLTRTTAILREHADVLDAYSPDPARVGVVFDGVNHQLEWAFSGRESTQSGNSVLGYLLCLERMQVPYDILEAAHLPALDGYEALFLPWPMIVRAEAADALRSWVANGGTLVVESELDAFDELGLYRYPDERPFPAALGIRAVGRRPLDGPTRVGFAVDGTEGELVAASWLDPLLGDGEALASTAEGTIVLRRRHGAGTAIAVGTHAGLAYRFEPYGDFQRLIHVVLDGAGALPEIVCSEPDGERIQWRIGSSGARRLLFVVNNGDPTTVAFTGSPVRGQATDLFSGREIDVSSLSLDRDDVKVLVL